MSVDDSKCPVCDSQLESWVSNIYKCQDGHLLALEFESKIRPPVDSENVVWINLMDKKEYPVKLLEEEGEEAAD